MPDFFLKYRNAFFKSCGTCKKGYRQQETERSQNGEYFYFNEENFHQREFYSVENKFTIDNSFQIVDPE